MHKAKQHSETLRKALWEFLSFWENWVFIIPLFCWLGLIVFDHPTWESLQWFALGWLCFLPQEYLVHVYILHFPIPKHPTLYRLFYRLHYGHHDLPKRLDLMFMPLWLTLPMLGFNCLAFYYGITNDPHQLWCMLSGLYTGYLLFEWTHALNHVPYTPQTKIGKYLKTTHLWHHHHNEHYWFGVSLPAVIFDLLCFTSGDQKKRSASDTGRYLGLASNDPNLLQARQFYARHSNGALQHSRLWLKSHDSTGEPHATKA